MLINSPLKEKKIEKGRKNMILSFRGGTFCVEISKTFSKLLFTVCNRELMIRKLSRRLMKKFDTHEKKKKKTCTTHEITTFSSSANKMPGKLNS